MKKTPLPPNLRSIPKGYVYLGKGGEFKRLPRDDYFLGYNMRKYDLFNESERDGTKVEMWAGCSPDAFYFAPVDSEIARLNGHKPRAPKVAKPVAPPVPTVQYVVAGDVPWDVSAYIKIEGDKQTLVAKDGTEEPYLVTDTHKMVKQGRWRYADEKTALSKLDRPPAVPPAPKPPERPPVKRGDIIKTSGELYIVAYIEIGGAEGVVLVNLSNGSRWKDEILKFGFNESAPIPKSYLYDKYEVLDRKTVLTLPT